MTRGRGAAASSPDDLSRLLVAIRTTDRADRGLRPLSQHAAGQLAAHFLDGRPLSQARVSRAENGTHPLSPAEADAYARGCQASAERRRELVDLVRVFAPEAVTSRAVLVRRPHLIQARIGRLEAESTLIRSWQDAIVPGMLQTPAWTAAAFGDPGPEWWEARERRLALLADRDRSWHFVLSEAALRWNLGAEVMAEQLDHLAAVITQHPHVQVGVVPLASPKTAVASGPFRLYGRRTVEVSTPSGTYFDSDPGEVTAYEQRFDFVDEIAAYDEDALMLVAALRRAL